LENIAKMANTKEYALVTGAAAGMGREYVRLLAGRGYGIIAVDINGLRRKAARTISLR
jgi:NAD(P)-dependent dehydrogenase (short-subunit alcohol dehydrogenase family)